MKHIGNPSNVPFEINNEIKNSLDTYLHPMFNNERNLLTVMEIQRKLKDLIGESNQKKKNKNQDDSTSSSSSGLEERRPLPLSFVNKMLQGSMKTGLHDVLLYVNGEYLESLGYKVSKKPMFYDESDGSVESEDDPRRKYVRFDEHVYGLLKKENTQPFTKFLFESRKQTIIVDQ